MNSNRRSSAGFTLVELLVVVSVVGVLAMIAAPAVELAAKRGREQELKSALREVRAALDEHKRLYEQGRIKSVSGGSGYPERLEVLVEGVVDEKASDGRKIKLLRRIPEDPMSVKTGAGRRAWGLRSYESDAADPKEGRDVFDVYSTSTEKGLNGVPYREW